MRHTKQAVVYDDSGNVVASFQKDPSSWDSRKESSGCLMRRAREWAAKCGVSCHIRPR